jgi:LacI family transcriptional regulator
MTQSDTTQEPERRRAGIDDVARAAGVSTATVDRVLHQRGGVRRSTAHRVLNVAVELGYLPQADLLASLQPRPMRLAFVLPAGTNRYLRLFGDTINAPGDEFAGANVACRCHTIESFNPKALAARLLLLGREHDGVAFMALEHPLVREAVHTLHASGVSVLTLISDLANAPRAAFVGMDNRAAGRTAGLLLGRFIGATSQPGKVAMFAGSLSYRGHEEREMGFRHILAESFPGLEVVGLREGHDDADNNYRQAQLLLSQHPDIVGIYNVGGASDGIVRALKEVSRAGQVAFIGHGLTPETRALLIEGSMDAVINVTPQALLRNAIRAFNNLREQKPVNSGVEAIPISIVLRENLP